MRRQIINLIIHHITSDIRTLINIKIRLNILKSIEIREEKKLKTKPPVNYEFDYQGKKEHTTALFNIALFSLISFLFFFFIQNITQHFQIGLATVVEMLWFIYSFLESKDKP